MTKTTVSDNHAGVRARRIGYGAVMLVNAGLLVIGRNVHDWGWFEWLTEDYGELVPLITVVFVAGIVVNLVLIFADPSWLKSGTEIITGVLGLTLVVRTLQVYPFDFDAYDFDWDLVVRSVLLVGGIGAAVGLLTELRRLMTST